MGVSTVKRNRGTVRRECLDIDCSSGSSVKRITHDCTSFLQIKVLRPFAYFFIAREQDSNRAVRYVWILHPVLNTLHDGRHPSFVIRLGERRKSPFQAVALSVLCRFPIARSS